MHLNSLNSFSVLDEGNFLSVIKNSWIYSLCSFKGSIEDEPTCWIEQGIRLQFNKTNVNFDFWPLNMVTVNCFI
jgi:hypothetical protein